MKYSITLLLTLFSLAAHSQNAQRYNKIIDGKKSYTSITFEDDTIIIKHTNRHLHRGGYEMENGFIKLWFDEENIQYCGENNRYAEYRVTEKNNELSFKATNLDNGCPELDSVILGLWVPIQVQVSVENLTEKKEQYSVYPNPASGQFTVIGKKSKLSFTSIDGAFSGELEINNPVDCVSWPRGMYYIEEVGIVVLQ